MLKIKDDVALKELEKYGFDDLGVCYKKYVDFGVQFIVNKETRELKRLHPYSLREEPSLSEVLDLGIDRLVEE